MKRRYASMLIIIPVCFALQLRGQDPQAGSVTGNPKDPPQKAAKAEIVGNFYNAAGTLIATIDEEGWIRSADDRALAQYTENGEYFLSTLVKAGSVENGVILDRDGNKFARITKEGEVKSPGGKRLGSIAPDGTVTDSKGNRLGSAPGVDINVVALLFFYQRSLNSPKYGEQ